MLTLRERKRSSRMRLSFLTRVLPAIGLIFTLQLLTSVAVAQQAAADVKIESDIEVLIKAEADLQLLNSGQFVRDISNLPYRVEKQLNGILQRDPNTPFRFQVEQDLISIGEILAEHNLAIATFYLKRSNVRGSTKGAEGRLLQITRAYPQYSKMDQVLLELAEISVRNERPDDAATYLKRLSSDYPSSNHLTAAFAKLYEIAARSWESTEKPEPQ